MENDNTSNDVIVEEPVETSQTTEPAKEEVVQQAETTTDSVTVEEKVEPEQEVQWKNRAYELERKLGNLTNELPKIIEETLVKQNQPKQEDEYTVAQLIAYKREHPEHEPWVEEQLHKLGQKELLKTIRAEREQEKAELIRIQSFGAVINDPKYSEAFVVNEIGQKVWNPSSILAKKMDVYLRDPDVAKRPDAWAVAAKLARADVLDMQLGNKEQKLTSLKRQNAQLKQKTLVEGGGTNNVKPLKDEFQSASEKLAQTGKRDDAKAAVAAYFKKIGRV